MDILVVIARYKEDVSWVLNLQIPYLIINKGPPIQNRTIQKHSISVPNSVNGREAHSYFWYIVNHYDTLPDKIVFIQADPFEHQPDILSILNSETLSKLHGCVGLSRYYNETIPRVRLRNICGQYYINGIECWHGHYDDTFTEQFPIINNGSFWRDIMTGLLDKLNIEYTKETLREQVFKLFEIPYSKNKVSPYFHAAQFVVDKERVLHYEKEYYIRNLELSDTIEKSAYVLELLWPVLFGEDGNLDLKELRHNLLNNHNGAVHLC